MRHLERAAHGTAGRPVRAARRRRRRTPCRRRPPSPRRTTARSGAAPPSARSCRRRPSAQPSPSAGPPRTPSRHLRTRPGRRRRDRRDRGPPVLPRPRRDLLGDLVEARSWSSSRLVEALVEVPLRQRDREHPAHADVEVAPPAGRGRRRAAQPVAAPSYVGADAAVRPMDRHPGQLGRPVRLLYLVGLGDPASTYRCAPAPAPRRGCSCRSGRRAAGARPGTPWSRPCRRGSGTPGRRPPTRPGHRSASPRWPRCRRGVPGRRATLPCRSSAGRARPSP